MVGPARLELASSWFVARRSIHLSYGPASTHYVSVLDTMTRDEERSLIANILLEHVEAKQALALRREMARRYGEKLRKVGETLEQRPAELQPDSLDLPDAGKLKALLAEIAELEARVAHLDRTKREIGCG